MDNLINILLLVFLLPLAMMVGYLLLLTITAFMAPATTKLIGKSPVSRFLFLVPAHNEERLLPATLDSLNQLSYPADLYEVHVVADNCDDRTGDIATAKGAIAHERNNPDLRGKGYALQWLLQRLWDQKIEHDAVIILDADTVVSQNFLTVMDSRLQRGERIIQAYYAVRDPDRSSSISLRYAALAVLHYLRPQGRMILGGSTGLKGNGMVFHHEVMRNHEWSSSLTEDIEFHMAQILKGERVMFAPDAVVEAEMPANLADANTQNERWERGRIEMARRFVPQLLQNSWSTNPVNSRFLLFDAAVEHLIPPFSILMGGSLAGVILTAVAFIWSDHPLALANFLLAIFLILGQFVYLISGLRLAKAPVGVYKALLYAPGFMIWKIWLYLRVLINRSDDTWVRTARNQ
ncbi:MAG: glycosyltransferase family 2 protein [Ardenticatenaceae bacterium]|nr:glycosyltransferase family 2 protein [Ardenticatenaceae bacterium]